jgi:hypothetical protein
MFFCGDIRVLDDKGVLIYEGPTFLRCEQYGCRKMVTHGYLEKHGKCYCGGIRFRDAVLLTDEEQEGLRAGKYPLAAWEQAFIWEELASEQAAQVTDRDSGV